jgi:F0F1-type ATP synthase assembly protein I
MVPIASGGVQGSVAQEVAIRVLLMSSAASLIGALLFILWGLRSSVPAESGDR